MLTSLFKKQHERNARLLPAGELERRPLRRAKSRPPSSPTRSPRRMTTTAPSKGGRGGELAQLGAIWFPAGLGVEKLAFLENCSIEISFWFFA
jgi:hypothetical protein